MAELRLTLLGEFGLSTSARCAILNKKAQALLAFLAMPPGRAHRREKLASMLWGDRSEESARQNLRQCLTAIRRACPTGEALPVVTEGDSLRLNTTHVTVDVSEFEEALREPDPAGLGRVFTLYRGELLEGLSLPAGSFEEWLIGERRRLTALAIRALTQLLEHQERSGRHEDAMQTALRLLTIDPLQEAVHRALMRLHHETGNTAQALRQFGICEKILRRELNVEPEAATRELRRDILRSRSQPGSVQEQREARPIEVRPAQTGTSGRGSGQQNRTAAEGDQSVEGIVSRGGPGEPMSHAPSNGPPLPNAIEILRELDAPMVPSDRPSVAVIPFHSYSDDPRHAALADAICEDITTTLSGLSRLMVIACSSSLCYKGKTVDARTAGRELGVAHVLEGSVRILGSRVRISAQLVDTSSGAYVWADRYDRETEDAFRVPDEITQEIVTALEVKLTHGEQIRAWRRDAVSPEAYQHFVRGREAYLTFSRSAMGRAREELEHAISINANFATAHVLLGFTHAEDARFQWGSSREEALSKARAAARKGLALNAGCGAAHSLLAYVAMQDRRFDDAIGEGGRAVAIGPSDAEAYHVLAMARIYNGDFAEGIRLERRSLRLNLLALENHLVMLGRAYFHMGRFDDAIGVLERVRQRKPYWLSARTLLAGCFAQSGRLQLARQTATEILRIRPDFSTGRWAQLQPYRRPQDLDRYLSSLHAAGLPASSHNLRAVREAFDDRDRMETSELPTLVADRPSLAVLPFENLSEEAALGLVADGLVEDVLTLLARVPGFFVIARRSSFFYRRLPRDIRRVGHELGIRYVVGGSIRGAGDRVRIVATLFEAESGKQHWAGQYDVKRSDALELQDRIAGDLIAELQPQLTRVELTKIRRRRPDSLDAWAHYHEAVGAITLEGFTEQSMTSAIEHLRQATALDKDFALAYSLLALWIAYGAKLSFLPNADLQYSQAKVAAERAVALDPNGPEVIGYAGCALVAIGDMSNGRELVERAIELDPSNPQARVSLGATQVRAGEYERGIENMRLGIRSSPRDYGLTWWSMGLANALRLAGRLEDALPQVQTVCRRDGRLHMARVLMASILTELGRPGEARDAIINARRIRPALNLSEIARFFGTSVADELQAVWE